MYYEINVAKLTADKKYRHFFATAKRSCTELTKTYEILTVIVEKFPEPEYIVTMSYQEESGVNVDVSKFLKKPKNPCD